MSEEPIELVRGSGNVFRDLGKPNADLEQLRAILAARIVKVMDENKMTVREAQEAFGVPSSELSRIRRAKLDRYTVDRLMNILSKLDQEVEVSVDVHPRKPAAAQGSVALVL